MIKCWHVSFEPTTKYFQHRHLWILLPGLPLQLWNARALEAIGNEIGWFIMVDEQTLKASSKRVGKILVEVDIHLGLLETLENEWRG